MKIKIMNTETRVCPPEYSWALSNKMRKIVHSPEKILGNYIQKGMNVLDIGCGPGFFTIPMSAMTGPSGTVTAVDFQAGMLIMIHDKIENTIYEQNIKLHHCSKEQLNITGEYDFALTFYMVHEVPYPVNLMKDIYSILKKDGKYLLVEPKGHVSKEAFEKTVELAKSAGFKQEENPSVFFSRAVLFVK